MAQFIAASRYAYRTTQESTSESNPNMKQRTVRLALMSVAGMFVLGASPVSALSSPPVSATDWSREFGKALNFNAASIPATQPNAPVAARVNQMKGREPQDTGSPDLFGTDLDRAFRQFKVHKPSSTLGDTGSEPPSQINLVFHVLSGPSLEGSLSESVLTDQISVLNDAYRSAGLHFNIAEVRRYPDSPYFAGGCFPTTEQGIRMKSELAVDPARFVTVYTCRLALPYIAGYATLPNEFPEADPRHGVVVDYSTVPGSTAPLDLGHTLAHELGHYFGLLHTFQGGCVEPGDGISDTPAEASPAFGCQIGRDSCAQAGADPINNFMDYSDDACTDRFTSLQNERMQALIRRQPTQPGRVGVLHWSRNNRQLVRPKRKRSRIQHRGPSRESDACAMVRVRSERGPGLDRRHRTDHRQYRRSSGLSSSRRRWAFSAELQPSPASKPTVGNAHIHIHGLQQRAGELAVGRCRVYQRFHSHHATDDTGRTDLPVGDHLEPPSANGSTDAACSIKCPRSGTELRHLVSGSPAERCSEGSASAALEAQRVPFDKLRRTA